MALPGASGNGSNGGGPQDPAGSGGPRGLARFVKPGPPPPGTPPDLLERFQASQRPKPQPGEVCELCNEPIPEEHGHIVGLESRELKCVCRPCYLLFTSEDTSLRYRSVPQRFLVDPFFNLDEAQWEQIEIPVSMAFLFRNSSLDRWVAFYPSPAGATESLLDLESWQEVLDANPAFEGVMSDVEALLLKQEDGRFECYLVPIDTAYELTALVRMNWKGFSGGEEVWGRIDAFFETLRGRSAVVGPKGSQSPRGGS